MFSDLTLDELNDLQTQVRASYTKLVQGIAVSEIRYGEMSRRFAPTTPEACRGFLVEIAAEIHRRGGRRSRAIHPVGV